jgi:hypothetical protein
MSDTQVGRPPAGSVAKAASATALRAYVAARLEQQSDQPYLDELGVALSRSALSRAGASLLWHRPDYRPRGRTSMTPNPAGPPGPVAFRDWLAVHPQQLDLKVELLTMAFKTKPAQTRGAAKLRTVPGVVQLLRVAGAAADGQRSLIAIALSDDADDRRRLHDSVAKIGAYRWQEVEEEIVEPAVATWRHLAQLAAAREGLVRAAAAKRQSQK